MNYTAAKVFSPISPIIAYVSLWMVSDFDDVILDKGNSSKHNLQ